MAKLSQQEIAIQLAGCSGWQLVDAPGPLSIIHKFGFSDFVAAMYFVNAVAALAEAADHHPDIDIRYNSVKLVLSTHSAGGLTSKDFDMARRIDTLFTEKS